MEGMQCYRPRTFPCHTADMTVKPIPIFFQTRPSRPAPFHDPNPIRLIRLIRHIFFLTGSESAPDPAARVLDNPGMTDFNNSDVRQTRL